LILSTKKKGVVFNKKDLIALRFRFPPRPLLNITISPPSSVAMTFLAMGAHWLANDHGMFKRADRPCADRAKRIGWVSLKKGESLDRPKLHRMEALDA